MFCETLQRQFPSVNTILKFTESSIDIAKKILPQEASSDAQFMELFSVAIQREQEVSNENVRHYNELLNTLADIAQTPNMLVLYF